MISTMIVVRMDVEPGGKRMGVGAGGCAIVSGVVEVRPEVVSG